MEACASARARGGRAHPEDPGLEVVVRGEVHRDRAAGLVALRLGVLLRGGHELVREHLGVGVEALVVARRELDGEQVGHDGAAVAEHSGPVVHRAAHRRRDLDGLHLRLERPRECAVDGSLEASLDTVEQSHRWFLLGVGAPIVTAKPWCQRRVLACIAQVDGARDGPVLSYGPSYSTLCERARVAERQTRWLQVPVSERAWGFKSPLAHRWRPESLQVRGPGRFSLPPENGLAIPKRYFALTRSLASSRGCRSGTGSGSRGGSRACGARTRIGRDPPPAILGS